MILFYFILGDVEEDNTTVEDPKDVLKDNVKEENLVAVTAAEDKDFHEKVDGLDSGDLPIDKQKLSKLKGINW